MTKDAQRPSAAMEGKGAYNRHSLIPSAGGALALPHLQRAIAETPLVNRRRILTPLTIFIDH